MPSGARRRGGFAGIPAGLLLGLEVELLAQPESRAVSGLGIRPWKVDGIELVAVFCSSGCIASSRESNRSLSGGSLGSGNVAMIYPVL